LFRIDVVPSGSTGLAPAVDSHREDAWDRQSKKCVACGHRFETGWECPTCRFRPDRRDGILFFAPQKSSVDAGYDPQYFARIVRYESSHFWFVARMKLIVWLAEKFASNVRDYLELGCGTGAGLATFTSAFPAWRIAGTEVLATGLRNAASIAPAAFLFQADAANLPLHNCVDLAGAFDVLEHIDDDRAVLAELHRVLRPSGRLVLTVPQHAWLWSGADSFAHHRRRYSREDLLAKVREAGFRTLYAGSFNTLLLPALLLSRLKRNSPTTDPWREFEIPGWLNRFLVRVMSIERFLIRSGVRFPIGGSLIIVACKDPSDTPSVG
jgi:SAM-dependent methyltransferase